MLKKILCFIICSFYLWLNYAAAGKIDSSIGQMLRGFNGNFYADALRAGAASDNPNILLNPALSYKSKYISSLEFYTQDRYSKISEPVKYRNINFIVKERELFNIPDIQFGLHYSSFALENIAEYNMLGGQPIFGGFTNDEESLILLNFNAPVVIRNEAFRIGGNIKFYKHSLADASANAQTFDAGILWKKTKFNIGFALKNLLSTDLKYKNAAYNLPRQYVFGANYNFNVSDEWSLGLNSDYTLNTQNTDDNQAFGIDFKYKPSSEKYSFNFIYGTDNIYIAHSLALKFEYNRSFNCGFGYSVNRSRELGDNTLFFAGWNFGTLEEKKFEKYLELEAAGEKDYRNGDWRGALNNWSAAADLYASKKTTARISRDLLNAQLQVIERLNLELYNSNKLYFEKGIENFKAEKYYDALLNFAAVKFSDDASNRRIFNDSSDYIRQITELIKQAEIVSRAEQHKILIDTTLADAQKTNTKIIQPQMNEINNLFLIVTTLIDINKLELAQEYLDKYQFSDTEKINLNNQLNVKKKKNDDYQNAKNRYRNMTAQLRDYFKNNEFAKVIDVYNQLIADYTEYDFQNNSDFEIYRQIAADNMKVSEKPVKKISASELQAIDDYYKSAAKHYLNFLQTNDKSELFKSIILYERILKINPEHKSKTDYHKAKALYEQ